MHLKRSPPVTLSASAASSNAMTWIAASAHLAVMFLQATEQLRTQSASASGSRDDEAKDLTRQSLLSVARECKGK